MNASVSILRPAAANPATRPPLTDALRATVGAKAAEIYDRFVATLATSASSYAMTEAANAALAC